MEEKYVVTMNGVIKASEVSNGYIREISTKEELEELIERMPYIQTIQAPNSKVRKELYQLAMNEYNDVEWVKVVKSAYLRMKDGQYEQYETEYAEKAKDFLHKEISIRFGLPLEKTENYINKMIEKQLKELGQFM